MSSCILMRVFLHTNKRLPPYIIKFFFHMEDHNRNNRLAWSLLTLIGSCRIYHVFKTKAGRFRKRSLPCNRFAKEKKSSYHQYPLKHCSKQASRIERYTSVDDWISRESPASKDSHFCWTCIPTDLCGYGWQTHSTNNLFEFASL